MAENYEDPVSVIITAPDGTEEEFVEDVVLPFEGKEFAILVAIPQTEEDMEDPEIILARIDKDGETGEPVYVPPTDEEYDAVAKIYDEM